MVGNGNNKVKYLASLNNISIKYRTINKDFYNIRSLIGYCPQFDVIFDFLTVYENLEFYGIIKGAKKEKIK